VKRNEMFIDVAPNDVVARRTAAGYAKEKAYLFY
jgi:hypothetical protein